MAFSVPPSAALLVFNQTAAQTVANTTTETSGLGAGVGSLTLPANFLTVGRTIRIKGGGIYSTLITPGNLTVRVKYGGVTIASVVVGTLLGSASNAGFDFECVITCRSIGASGTVVCAGLINYAASGSNRLADYINTGTGTTTVNTTTSNALEVTIQWSSASASNTLTTIVATVEAVN